MERDIGRSLQMLGAAERRRLRRVLLWTVAATCAAFAFLLLLSEVATGGAGPARVAAYGASAILLVIGIGAVFARWTAPAAGALEIAARLEKLFPQARGRIRASLARDGSGLPGIVVEGGREWLARRGSALERALSEDVLERSARARRSALVLAALVLAAAFAQPTAARRAARALLDPATLWAGGTDEWRVEPGDAEVAYGASVAGAAWYDGAQEGDALVLEWREGERSWRADTLAAVREGSWRWGPVTVERRYRLRFGRAVSPDYRLEVAAPLALLRVEGRSADDGWTPLAGRTIATGDRLEIRGEANGPLGRAFVVDAAGRVTELAVAGGAFRGPVRALPPGSARIVAIGTGGIRLDGPAFLVAPRGSAFVEILRPSEDPATLAAESAWLEVRAGAPRGLASLTWETIDGRSGLVAQVAGARDTLVTAIAPLASGRAPGDTVRWRVVARPAAGAPAATPWRLAIVASADELRIAADEERANAARRVADALEEVRRAGEERATGGSTQDDAELDQRLAEAADSLARSLERTLADPELDPELAERLEGYRRQLEGVARAELDPARGMPPDPAAEAEARAAVLEAISERLDRIEHSIAREAAADSLETLADAQSELAERTRTADPAEMERGLAERQEALAEAALETAGELSAQASEGLEEALAEVERRMQAGDAAAAADAQDRAAAEMMQAAGETRAEESGDAAGASHTAALDRAGAESLFLAERQRELADRRAALASGGERAARLARQRVVTGGLERALGTMVEAIGGMPAGMELAMRIAQAVYATRQAEAALERSSDGPAGASAVRAAAEDAATSLALLSRALFLPEGGGGGAGGAAAQAGASGQLSRDIQDMAAAQNAMADALAGGVEPVGGAAEASGEQRGAAERLREMAAALEEEGIDGSSVDALARAIERSSTRLERGLAGARTESELRSIARRLAELGRLLDERREERRSETARAFLPADPPPLDARVIARVLDPEAALAAWAGMLPAELLAPARRYLERLADEGVREDGR